VEVVNASPAAFWHIHAWKRYGNMQQESDDASAFTWKRYGSMQKEGDDAAFTWKKYGSMQNEGDDASAVIWMQVSGMWLA